MVVAVCLCAAGGRVRAADQHRGASELHAAVAAMHVTARHVATRRVSAATSPLLAPPPREDLAPPRIAIVEDGASPAGLLDLERATHCSARGPPRA